jgi:hypothetical protein
MRTVLISVLTVCVLAVVFMDNKASAFSDATFNPTSAPPTEHEKILKYQDQLSDQAYPRNFIDEAAQALRIHNGRWEALTSEPSRGGLASSLSAGMDSGRPMIELQWRPERQ